MHAKRSKAGQVVVMLAVLSAPDLAFCELANFAPQNAR